jgi:hypothetical protein
MSPYSWQSPITDTFVYAPPWAVAFAVVSWMPVSVQAMLLLAAQITSLRVIGGSWRGAGIACWFPLVAYDLVGGNFNLVLAAAIVLAVQGSPRLAVATGLAKFAPALAIDPRDWRPAATTLGLAIAVTLPCLQLWPDWLFHLLALYGQPVGPQVPVPLGLRLALGMVLLLAWRPWSRALAAAVTIPALYYGSLVILLAPIAVCVRGYLATRTSPPTSGSGTVAPGTPKCEHVLDVPTGMG